MYLVTSSECTACDAGKLDGPRYWKVHDLLVYTCRTCSYQVPDLPLYRRTGDRDVDKMILEGIVDQIKQAEANRAQKRDAEDDG